MIQRSGSFVTLTVLPAAVALVVVLLAGCESPASDPVGPQGTTLLEGYPAAHAEDGDQSFLGDGTEPELDDGQTSQILVSLGSVCVTVTFEDQAQGEVPAPPPGAGATFSSNWFVVNNGNNYSGNPSGVGVASWSTTPDASVHFDPPVYEVGFYYASAVTVEVAALDASGAVVASASLPANHTPSFSQWDPVQLAAPSDVIVSLQLSGDPTWAGIDDLTFCREDEAIEVEADVKPGNEDEIDPTNLNQKNVPLAILTTADFDATTIDAASLLVSDPGFPAGAVGVSGAKHEDVDQDGDLDLLVAFDASALADAGGITGDTDQLLVTGETTDGRPIVGIDDVRVVGNP